MSTIINIKAIGKYTFIVFFSLGSLCFFGYLFSKEIQFAEAGFLLLLVGIIIHFIEFFLFIIISVVKPQYADDCIEALGYLAYNFLAGLVYTTLGFYAVTLH